MVVILKWMWMDCQCFEVLVQVHWEVHNLNFIMWSWWTFVYCCEVPWTFVIGLFWVTWNIVNITTFGVPIVYIFSPISIHLCYLYYNKVPKVLIVCTHCLTILHLNWSNCKKVLTILIVCTCWVFYLSIWVGQTITKSIKSL